MLAGGPSTARATVTSAVTTATQQQTVGKFLYVGGDGRAQDFDIYVENAAGTALVDLSDNDVMDQAPKCSPNGREIAFSSDRDADRSLDVLERPFEVCVMNEDGSDVRRLTNNPAWDGAPEWSPNGRQIAVGTLVMDADGSNARQLDIPSGGPRVSVADWTHP